jgi:HD-GYP domain-containing protein (c-di-GMP phosphodiesterase class II)
MNVRDENEYEDLLAEWSDLESGVGVALRNPESAQQFAARITQYDRWMQSLLELDQDVGLYLLFQLAGHSAVGYSASHALVSAVLCQLIAKELALPTTERDSLVRAAFTMNVAMTAMQDLLANQVEKPSPEQQDMIRTHPIKAAMLLGNLGVQDEDWLEIVSMHHDDSVERPELHLLTPPQRLIRILKMVDRYAAMISPRMTRAGRTATESARSIMASAANKTDVIAHALVKVVGLCPPGTFVRLDSGEVAVVVKRSSKANQPLVAIVTNAEGELLRIPRLHATAQAYPRIKQALGAGVVHAPLGHYFILQISGHMKSEV